jgi:transposase-like protein
MPWKKFSVLEARAQFVLALKNKSESFASVCGRFGISRKSGYKWWQRYRAGGLKALGNASRRAAPPRENAPFCLANAVAQTAPGASALGSKKVATAAQKSFPSSPARSGGEHLGALAGGAAFGEEAQAPGAARTGLAMEEYTRQKAATKCGQSTSKAGFARAMGGAASR